jgi:hypothetical protein
MWCRSPGVKGDNAGLQAAIRIGYSSVKAANRSLDLTETLAGKDAEFIN